MKSICLKCLYNRRPWSEERMEEGWVGCIRYGQLQLRDEERHTNNATNMINSLECENYGFGWIDNHLTMGGKEMGIGYYNDMLLTMGCKKCNQFEKGMR